jgi:hypothetical protein
MPVFAMKSILPVSEYNKWLIFLQDDEPDVTEIQLAVLTTMVSNGLGGKGKVKDFIIRKPKVEKKPQGVGENEVRGALGLFAKKAK